MCPTYDSLGQQNVLATVSTGASTALKYTVANTVYYP